MYRITQIFDGDYGCEEREENVAPQVSVTLEDEEGNEKQMSIRDAFLRTHNLEEGDAWPYAFYGSLQATVPAVIQDYPGITNPLELYDVLRMIWCADTCAPRMRSEWTQENPTLGQCSITAFLAQDIFGGEVYGILRAGGNYHCYNVVRGHVFDLTSEQFGDETLSYEGNPLQSREVHFTKKEKYQRYLYLKEELRKLTQENA